MTMFSRPPHMDVVYMVTSMHSSMYMYCGTSDKGHSDIRTTSDNGQTKMHQFVCR